MQQENRAASSTSMNYHAITTHHCMEQRSTILPRVQTAPVSDDGALLCGLR